MTHAEAVRIAWDLCLVGAVMVVAVVAVAVCAWYLEHGTWLR